MLCRSSQAPQLPQKQYESSSQPVSEHALVIVRALFILRATRTHSEAWWGSSTNRPVNQPAPFRWYERDINTRWSRFTRKNTKLSEHANPPQSINRKYCILAQHYFPAVTQKIARGRKSVNATPHSWLSARQVFWRVQGMTEGLLHITFLKIIVTQY